MRDGTSWSHRFLLLVMLERREATRALPDFVLRAIYRFVSDSP
jgi:hypothetical protein